jgi:hypothetical protein
MKATVEHIRAGCNANTGAVAWGSAGNFSLVAFAAHSAVLIVDPQVRYNLLCMHDIS